MSKTPRGKATRKAKAKVLEKVNLVKVPPTLVATPDKDVNPIQAHTGRSAKSALKRLSLKVLTRMFQAKELQSATSCLLIPRKPRSLRLILLVKLRKESVPKRPWTPKRCRNILIRQTIPKNIQKSTWTTRSTTD